MLLNVSVICRAGEGEAGHYWRNVWEVDMGALAVFDPTAASAIGVAAYNFHRPLLCPEYYVDRVVVSTYSPDGALFPDNFLSIPYGLPGTRSGATGDLMGIETCLVLRKTVAQGRNGRLWLRGYLREVDVTGTSGGVLAVNGAATVNTTLDTAFSTFRTAVQAAGGQLVLARGAEPLVNVRPVTGVQVLGAANHNLRRRVKRQISASSPLAQIVKVAEALGNAAEVVNPIISAYNALPYPDVPLLPD